MVLVKRYPNRKLYDTEAKQYITLESIAEMIRQGKDVTVIDFTSGEDLTALTLTQIIVEQEKKQGSALPRDLLASLIRAGEEGMAALQRTIHSSLGFLSQFEEETRRRVQDLVKQGDLSEREAELDIKKAAHPQPRPTGCADERRRGRTIVNQVAGAIACRLSVPHRPDRPINQEN